MAISGAVGGPFHAGRLHWPGVPVVDDGGSIIEPGEPVEVDCMVQIDQVTEAMRQEAGYTDRDVRMLVLAPGLERRVDTDAIVEVLPGAFVPANHVGLWSVASSAQDVLGFAFDGRGRRA
ncbi:hypothetical protein [Sphingomonas xinjiangensis]|uniref:Uncharacterized protein n=1 Tax=Sphingomonas xinjiangensis TaxID=643568 RepID=A0A840Y925_9SPHN|nr:hypothetical protein [Sphingomonas xinjiangensis]MBB5709344.1 hypothetical protein [Sphingomonas xinjiangensis]